MNEHIETAWQATDSKTKLRNTVAKRVEFTGINNAKLKYGIAQLDVLLEQLLPIAEAYDKAMCEGDIEGDSWSWGTRLMRCRYVLGCD